MPVYGRRGIRYRRKIFDASLRRPQVSGSSGVHSNLRLNRRFCAYKTSILSAYQREDIVCRNYTLVNLILYIFQGIVISICSNYYYYVLLIPVSTIALNIINAYAVDKYYPELICQGTIGQDTIFELKKQVCGLMIWKIGSATRNTLDNIIISIYFGLTSVTIYVHPERL